MRSTASPDVVLVDAVPGARSGEGGANCCHMPTQEEPKMAEIYAGIRKTIIPGAVTSGRSSNRSRERDREAQHRRPDDPRSFTFNCKTERHPVKIILIAIMLLWTVAALMAQPADVPRPRVRPDLPRTFPQVVPPDAPAPVTEKTPLTVAQALSMLQALRNLDGRQVVVKVNGADTTVIQPWEFASGTLRLRIAKNISALSEVEKQAEDARQAIVKEIRARMPAAANIESGTPEFEAFQRQYTEALLQPASAILQRIRASELKLDKNEIPVTALSALAPILDDE